MALDYSKGRVTSVNVTSHGPLQLYLEELTSRDIIVAQETHVTDAKLAAAQSKARDSPWAAGDCLGYRRWEPGWGGDTCSYHGGHSPSAWTTTTCT